MFCLIALIILSILGIFSAYYRELAKEAFKCVIGNITTRKKCESGLDKKLKGKVIGKISRVSPRLARIILKHFELFSGIFFLLFLISIIILIYNIYSYVISNGRCEGYCPISLVAGFIRIKKRTKESKARKDFKILGEEVIYLDSACMTLKPNCVVEKINEYYYKYPGCAGRSSHFIAEKVEREVKKSREIVKKFFNAKSTKEIIFCRNATEAINLIASTFPFNKGDKVLITDKEHNSNLLPWIKLEEKGKCKLKILKTGEKGVFNIEEFKILVKGVKLVAINYVSNLDGYINPVEEIIEIAHRENALVLLDAAQAAGHIPIDVRKLDVDFLCCSGHKMLGPTGTGILYGKKELLEILDTYNLGGDTVSDTNYPKYKLLDLPHKFEAGLQDYSGIIGLGKALQYLKPKLKKLEEENRKLIKILFKELQGCDIEILTKENNSIGIFSFIPYKTDSEELAQILSSHKICVRSGTFCVHNWFNKYNKKNAIRLSLHLYNTKEDIEKTIKVLREFL